LAGVQLGDHMPPRAIILPVWIIVPVGPARP